MKRIYLLLSLLAGCLFMQAAIYNVRDFGAKADGKTIDSPAINRAIEAAAQEGGGTVYLPAGEYACYSIRLKSNIHLYLEQGARIIAAFPGKDEGYDSAEPNEHNKYQDFGHSHWKNSLIWGIGLENITISGPGLIYGKGLTREESRLPGVGNKAISLKDCRNVTLKDFSMLHCGHFALLATGVEHLTLLNLKVDTNRDGFDIDCCRNVRISQCTVNSPWDDAIVLKASYALGRFKDTENVTISDCYVSGFDKGSVLDGSWQLDEPQAPDHGYRTGRIKLGTESVKGMLSDIEGLMGAFNSLNLNDMVQMLYGDAQQIEQLVNSVGQAAKLYKENKALIDVLNKYVTEGNLAKLEQLLYDMQRIDTSRLQSLAQFTHLSELLELLGKFDTNIGALAQFTRDYLDMAPTFESLNRDLSSPEVQQSLDNLPNIISQLQNLVNVMHASEQMLDRMTSMLGGESINKIIACTQKLENSVSMETLTKAQQQALTERMQAWLDFGSSYDIFTQRTEKMTSTVVFVYKSESIG